MAPFRVSMLLSLLLAWTLSTTLAVVLGITPLGCFKATGNFSVGRTVYRLTMDYCLSICRSGEYNYVAVTNGTTCSCGYLLEELGWTPSNDSGVELHPTADCNSTCPEIGLGKCGGPSLISLYSVNYAYNYYPVGCLESNPSATGLTYQLKLEGSYPRTSIRCISGCYSKQYHYAGFLNGTRCCCGQSYSLSEKMICEQDICRGATFHCRGTALPNVFKVNPVQRVTVLSAPFARGQTYYGVTIGDSSWTKSDDTQTTASILDLNSNFNCQTNSYGVLNLKNRIGMLDASANCSWKKVATTIINGGGRGVIILDRSGDIKLGYNVIATPYNASFPIIFLSPYDSALLTHANAFSDYLLVYVGPRAYVGDNACSPRCGGGGTCFSVEYERFCLCASGTRSNNCKTGTDLTQWYPYHCRESGGCSTDDTPLAVDEDILLQDQMAVRWSGWRSGLSPIIEYKLVLCNMMLIGLGTMLQEDSRTAQQWTTPADQLETIISVPNLPSGIYSLALQVKNEVGYQDCSRKLLFVDQDNAILRIDPNKFVISSGISKSGYEWMQVNVTGPTTLEVSFAGAIVFSPDLLTSWISARVFPYKCVDNVVSNLDDQSVLRDTLPKLLSQKGIDLVEYVEELTDDAGLSFESRALNNSLAFHPYTNLSTVYHRTLEIHERQTYAVAIRVLNYYGQTTTMTTYAHAVVLAPNVSEPWEEDTNRPVDDPDAECKKKIKVIAADTVAGIRQMDWTVFLHPDTNQVRLQQGSHVNSENKGANLTPSYCSQTPAYCYCPTTSSGAPRSQGCFAYMYEISFFVENCFSLSKSGKIFLEVRFTSYSGLEQVKVMNLWEKPPVKAKTEVSLSEIGIIVGALVGGTASLALVGSVTTFIVRRVKSAALPSARGKPLPVYSHFFVIDDPDQERSLTTQVHFLK